MKKDALGISELLPKKPSLVDEKDALGQGDTQFRDPRASTSIDLKVNVNVSKPSAEAEIDVPKASADWQLFQSLSGLHNWLKSETQ